MESTQNLSEMISDLVMELPQEGTALLCFDQVPAAEV